MKPTRSGWAEMEEWLEQLLAHEAEYFTFGAVWTQTPCAWYLDSDDLPDYHDCNRALRLRVEGRAPDAVARDVIAHFRSRAMTVTADVDPLAEEQGIGAALRRLGVTPVIGRMLLMCYALPTAPALRYRGIVVEPIVGARPAAATRDWIEQAVSDEESEEARAFWRKVAAREAAMPQCRLYLARIDGHPVGAADLFTAHGWGRIDSVVTHPAWRRRGIASAMVCRALRDSLEGGNTRTYLFTEQGGTGEKVYRRLGFETWAVDILRRHLLP